MKREQLTFTIDTDLADKIRDLAEEDERSISNYISLVLKKSLTN